jgi:accessory gene regulator B
MIDQFADKIAFFLNQRNEGIVSKAVMKFALIIILNVLSVIIIILSISLFTDTLAESALALFGFGILRFYSGGKHVNSSGYCVIISVVMFFLIIYTPHNKEIEIYLQIASVILVLIFAPAYLEDHIRIKKSYVPFLRMMSICIVLSNFYWDSSILTKCFFLQGLSLIEFGKKGGHESEN